MRKNCCCWRAAQYRLRRVAGRLVISSAGNLGFSIDYNLDGMRHLDPLNGGPIALPFPDALAEFKVENQRRIRATNPRITSIGRDEVGYE